MTAILLLLTLAAMTSAEVQPQAPRLGNNQDSFTVKGAVDAVRNALFGSPTYHTKQRWEFDPEVSRRRNQEYETIHGHRSVYLIERLGLGEDGREQERRQQQAVRDIGVPITGRR